MAEVLRKMEAEKYEMDVNFLKNLKDTKGKSPAAFGLRNKVKCKLS